MVEISEKLSNKLRNMSIVCAFFIVIMHVRPVFQSGTIPWYVKQFLEHGITYISVPFFFMASGFFLASNYYAQDKIRHIYANALRKRLKTLVIPYFTWMLLWFSVTLTLPLALHYVKTGELLINLPKNLYGWIRVLGLSPLGLTNLSVLWFVRNLMFLVLISPVAFHALRRFGISLLAFVFALYAMTYPWPERIFQRNFGDLLFFNGLFSLVGLFWFTLGMAFRIGLLKINVNRKSSIVCFLLGLAMSGLRAYFVLQGSRLPVVVFGFLSMLFYLCAVWGVMPDAAWPKWLVFSSFPVYLMHKFVLLFSGLVVAKFGGDSLFSYCLESALGCGIPILVAVFLHRHFPKVSAIIFGGR